MISVDIPVSPFHGMRIEFKRTPKDKLSPEQVIYRQYYEALGFHYHLADSGPEAAWNALRDYLRPKYKLPEWNP